MASAASNQTITAAETVLFNQAADGGHCNEFFVGVRSTAANPLQVHVDGLHKSGEFVGMPAGSSLSFKHNMHGIGKVLAKGEGGNCAGVDYCVISRVGF